jgi:hypothetical protein
MTDEERDRRLSVAEMDTVDLGVVYRHLSDALRLFGTRVRGTRPDECEAFFERWREQRARADAEADRIEEEIFEANVGITNDGPQRWGPL